MMQNLMILHSYILVKVRATCQQCLLAYLPSQLHLDINKELYASGAQAFASIYFLFVGAEIAVHLIFLPIVCSWFC